MKKLLVLFGIAGVAMLAWAASPRFPIKFGFLQSDLDANQQSITNALNLVGTHWGDGLHLSNVTATASGTAAGRLSGTYPNPGIASYSSAQLATDLSDENGGGPALFSTGDGGGLTKLNGLNITNWPTSLMGNPTGASASVIPIPLDATLSFVGGQLHSIAAGGSGIPLLNGLGTNTTITNFTGSGTQLRLYGSNSNGVMNARVNILDYGAIPDDGADDTAAIQLANDVLVLMGGGTLYAPAGRYQISATGVKLGSRVRLVGESGTDTDGGTRFSKTGAGYGFQLGFNKCEIDNIYIDGDGTANQRGITTTNISDVSQSTTLWSLNHVRVFNCPTAYWFHNMWDGMMLDCYADVGVDGIMFSNVCSATYVISGHYGGQETNGIHLSGGNNEGLIFNTTIEGAQIAGIFSDDTANGVDTQIEIENSWFEGNTNAVSLTNCDALRIQGCNLNSLNTNILLRGTFHVPSIKNNYSGGLSLLNCGSGTSGMELGPNADFNNNSPGIGATSYILSQTNLVVVGGGVYAPSGNFGTLVLTNLPGTSATRMLGVDSSGNVVTNPVPGGGSGVTSFNTRSGAVTFAPLTDFPNALTNSDNGRTGGAVINEPVTITNAMTGWMALPTGTNITFIFWGTNSSGAIKTNTFIVNPGSIGGGYNLEVQNTNSVDTFAVTQDGWIYFGTNKLAQISTNGIASFQGVTNLALTASSVTGTDPNKNTVSISNSHGVLTNTASGPASFGLLQNGELANSAITINGTSTALGGTASSNAGGLTNVNGQSLTGMVQSIQWDASAFMTNGSYNSNAITYVTPSAGSGGLQGSAPFYLLYPFTPNVAGTAVACTNQFFVQTYMPPEWNSNAVNFSVDVLLATNGPLTATSMVFSVAASWNGSALTTPVTVTNNVPLGVGFLSTNFVVGAIPTSGTITPNESVVFQVQYWSVGNGKITNNAWGLGARCALTNSPVQNGLVTQR